jgi:hypothetical protein
MAHIFQHQFSLNRLARGNHVIEQGLFTIMVKMDSTRMAVYTISLIPACVLTRQWSHWDSIINDVSVGGSRVRPCLHRNQLFVARDVTRRSAMALIIHFALRTGQYFQLRIGKTLLV